MDAVGVEERVAPLNARSLKKITNVAALHLVLGTIDVIGAIIGPTL